MSIVVVTNDKFSDKRKDALREEALINKEAVFRRWSMRTDASSYPLVMKAVGIIALPMLLLWAFLIISISIAITISIFSLRFLGSFIPKK